MGLLCDADGEKIIGEGLPEDLYQLFIKEVVGKDSFYKKHMRLPLILN